MSKNMIVNIKAEMHKVANIVEGLEYYSSRIFMYDSNPKTISCNLTLINMTRRIKDILFLINLNYEENDKLYGTHYLNVDATYILMRGVIESAVILNILAGQNDDISIKYQNQHDLDRSNISRKNNGCSKYLNYPELEIKPYKRYEWAGSLLKKRVVSIHDLIELCNLYDSGKDFLKQQINHINRLSHPHLTNDSRTTDALFGTGHTDTIMYIFEIILSQMFTAIGVLHFLDLTYSRGIYYNDIHNLEDKLPNINYIQKELNVEGVESFQIIKNNQYEFLSFYKKTYNLKDSIADHIYAINSFGSISVDLDKEYSPKKTRSLSKLLYSLADHMREFVISFETRNSYIFYTKLRYILEFYSTIFIIANSDENRVEMYQSHHDIKSFLEYNKIPQEMKDYFKDTMEDEVKRQKKRMGKDYKSSHQRYKLCIDFMLEYYSKIGIDISKKKLRNDNAWAINIVNKTNKSPKNIDLINYFVDNYQNSKEFSSNLCDYSTSLYALSCTYCHVSLFSILNVTWNEEKQVENEIYYFVMDMFKFLTHSIADIIPKYKDFADRVWNDKNPEYSIDNTIGIVLKKYKRYVTIK